MLERNFPLAWVSGRDFQFHARGIGALVLHAQGRAAQVRAVMFRGRAQYADFTPREGDKVEVRALVTLYAPRGDYQLNVEAIRRAGVGNLYEAFLQLKEKLMRKACSIPPANAPLPVFAQNHRHRHQPASSRIARHPDHAAAARAACARHPVSDAGARRRRAQKIAQAISTASDRAECDVLLVAAAAAASKTCGRSTKKSWHVPSPHARCRSFPASAMKPISRSPISPPTCARRHRLQRRKWLRRRAPIGWLRWIAHADDLTRAMRRQLRNAAQTLDWLSRRLVSPSAYISA